ncbi:MAG: bifunctional glutamate N-acetyltransferase/amino-acid acetyltransferase ArgJ [Bacillota bacterium]|jgi:glutamate N-acetyltransferase/amino-acid N-acetyltransferase
MSSNIKEIAGGITAVQGFKASGIHIGIKSRNPDKKDVAIIAAENICQVAGCYTKNKYAAAPVTWCREITKKGQARAIVINSGNANACTGNQGLSDVREMACLTADCLQAETEQILVCSTGVIGVTLPMDKVEAGIKAAAQALSDNGGRHAAQAIMTTDTFPKEIAISVQIGDHTINLGGMAKGSGMIHPDMATMLAFITTDALISAEALQAALSQSVIKSFNMVTVDGDTSTNDTVLVMANGLAANPRIEKDSPLFKPFCEALDYVCLFLAKMLAKDGEGATKLLRVIVKNGSSWQEAAKAAKAVVSSSLVKAAFFGEDANWGRIICALGYSGAQFDPGQVDIVLKSAAGQEPVMKKGSGLNFDEDKAARILAADEIDILVDLHDGTAEATAWGCDLSYKYVEINGCYRT